MEIPIPSEAEQKNGKQFVEISMDYYEKEYKLRVIKNLKKRAKQLGYNDGMHYFYFVLPGKKFVDINSDNAVVIMPLNKSGSQKWKFVPMADGSLMIISLKTGTVISVKSGNLA